MIEVQLSYDNFEYDIYSLVKAFYPKEDIVFTKPDITRRQVQETDLPLVFRVVYNPSDIMICAEEAGTGRRLKREVSLAAYPDYTEYRRQIKSELKKGLYEVLNSLTGKQLPWGTLTGIRPVKIPYAMLEEGMNDKEIYAAMKEEYLAADSKIALSIDIARRERELLSKIDYDKGYSLYVGIPFCPTRCLYCSFTSFPINIWEKRADEYVDALCREIDFTSRIMKGRPLNSFYMGGGTPTTLLPRQSEKLLKKIRESFDFSKCTEFTVEAGRPDSITEDKLRTLKEYGVDRISVNPQTMNQKTLDLIGRRHTVKQTVDAFLLARKCGFDNINMDLIAGLPGETEKDIEHTMREVSKLLPDSVTVHSLALKRAARLNERKEDYEDYKSVNTEEVSEMIRGYTKRMGLEPYYLYRQKNMSGNLENVGYAAAGKEGIYNILIMEEKQTIVALGAGSITKRVFPDGRIERCENVKDVASFIERIDEMLERKRSFFKDFDF